jgi:transcriptional regulator with XRE-family HTH domain
MPKRRPDSYLRTLRMKAGLSIPEFAKLTGFAKQTISKYELNQIPPSGRLILACELLFGVKYSKLFPSYSEAIEDDIGARARVLDRKLEGRDDARSQKVLAFLSEMANRRHSENV